MSALSELTRRLREIAEFARANADGIGRPVAPLELRDYLERELGLGGADWSARLQCDLVADEITRIVADWYWDDADTLARELEAIVDDEEPARADCLDCGTDTSALREYYMVHDEVWLEANPADDGLLCVGCLEERLGRRLEPDDFTDAPLNQYGSLRLLSRVRGIEEAPT